MAQQVTHRAEPVLKKGKKAEIVGGFERSIFGRGGS